MQSLKQSKSPRWDYYNQSVGQYVVSNYHINTILIYCPPLWNASVKTPHQFVTARVEMYYYRGRDNYICLTFCSTSVGV